MAAKRKNDNRQNARLVRYGVLLSSMLLLAIFSILGAFGQLQAFVDIKENYCKAIGTSNATSSTIAFSSRSSSTSKEAGDDCFRVNTNTIIENDSAKTVSNNIYDEKNDHNQHGKKLPEVAWLMSFPNSGTTYTNHLLQGYTNTTTATNYGQEQDTKKESISIFPDSMDGPFLRYPSWSLPHRYILTKTHCGGECDDCQTPGRKEYIDTIEAFEKACCTGKRIFNKTKVRTTYSADIPKRAVHLIRDPFDNIVARLHLKERRWGEHHNDAKYEKRVDVFNKTKEGFRAYCRFRDISSFKREFRQRILSDELLGYAKNIPCYAEFISYTQWHNHAIELVAKKSIPVLTLFYEDYALDWDKTVNQILNFLSLTPAQGAVAEKFILGKHYHDFYNEEEKVAAMKLLQTLASTELWDMLQRYFP